MVSRCPCSLEDGQVMVINFSRLVSNFGAKVFGDVLRIVVQSVYNLVGGLQIALQCVYNLTQIAINYMTPKFGTLWEWRVQRRELER